VGIRGIILNFSEGERKAGMVYKGKNWGLHQLGNKTKNLRIFKGQKGGGKGIQ